MKTLLRTFFVMICMNMIVTGCQRSKSGVEKPQQEVKINLLSEPQTLDPRKVRNLADINLAKMFMEGLTRTGKDGRVENALAQSIQISPDQKTYTIRLKPAKWSNGDLITAYDFLYAWKKTLSPDFLSDYAFQLYCIKNAEAIKRGHLPTSLLGAKALDEKTLEIQLNNPTPFFQELLGFPTFFPVHAQNDKVHADWAKHPDTFISNGPFNVSQWQHQNCIIATKNPNYWDARSVKLDQIEMIIIDEEISLKMFENHQLHWAGSPLSMIPMDAIKKLKTHDQLKTFPMQGTYWIRINTEKFPLNSQKIRKSLALSIERESIIEHILQGNQDVATGIVPKNMGLKQDPYFTFNKEEATKYLYEALEENRISDKKITELKLLYAANQRNHLIAQTIQNQWKENLGVSVHLEGVEAKIAFDRISRGDFQMAIGSWIADYNDPINFLEVFKSKNIGTNNTRWENAEYFETLQQTYLTTDPETRCQLLQTCEAILIDAMPIIPIFHYTMMYVQDEHLKNVILSPMGYIDFRFAYLTPQSRKER